MSATTIIEKMLLIKKQSPQQLPLPPLRKKELLANPSANAVVMPAKTASAQPSVPVPMQSEPKQVKGKKGKPDPYQQVKAFLDSHENPTKKEVLLYFAGKIKDIVDNL